MQGSATAADLRTMALSGLSLLLAVIAGLVIGVTMALAASPAGAADPRLQDLTIDNNEPFNATAVTLKSPGILLLRTESGKQGNVRLFGVDIPMLTNSCLSADGNSLNCARKSADTFDRILARQDNHLVCVLVNPRVRPAAVQCLLGEENLAHVLIANGHAYADSKAIEEQAAGRPSWNGVRDSYYQAQNSAKTNRRGIWSYASPAEDYRLRQTKPLMP